MPSSFGSKRLVTGARYGTTDWIAQRATGAVLALFLITLVTRVVGSAEPGRTAWHAALEPNWMRTFAFVSVVALIYHAWVGMRDVLMDYVKPLGVRLALQVFAIGWLLGCMGWATRILWRA